MMHIEQSFLADNVQHMVNHRASKLNGPNSIDVTTTSALKKNNPIIANETCNHNSNKQVNSHFVNKSEFSPNYQAVSSDVELSVRNGHYVEKDIATGNGGDPVDDYKYKSEETDDLEEIEEYELMHVVDISSEDTEQKETLTEEILAASSKDIQEELKKYTSIISNSNITDKLSTSSESGEEFHYKIYPVVKNRHLNSQSRKLYNIKRKITNRLLKSPDPCLKRRRKRNISPELYKRTENKHKSCHSINQLFTAEENFKAYRCGSRCHCKHVTQMGFEILNKIYQLLKFKRTSTSSSSSSDQASNHQTEHSPLKPINNDLRKRKRSINNEWHSESLNSPDNFKYRKVDNHFPRYIPSQEDEGKSYNSNRSDSKPKILNRDVYIANKLDIVNRHNINNMNYRRSLSQNNKSSTRKSMFLAPQVNQQLVRNTSYADIEFSDDDEPIIVTEYKKKPTRDIGLEPMAKLFNIPFSRREEEREKSAMLPQFKSHSSNVKQCNIGTQSYTDMFCRNHRNQLITDRSGRSSPCASELSTNSALFKDGLYFTDSHSSWLKHTRSVLAKVNQTEERNKYQEFLAHMVPRIYGSEQSKKSKISLNMQTSNRSANLVAAAFSKQNIPSTSSKLPRPKLNRFPLAPRINNLDEIILDDDEIIIEDIVDITKTKSSTKQNTITNKNRKSDNTEAAAIVTDDDDDDNDIISISKVITNNNRKKDISKKTIINLIDDEEQNEDQQSKDTVLPYVEPVNSLKERFKMSPHLEDNWLENWQSKWALRKQNRHDEVQQAAKKAEELSKERRLAEAVMQERMRKFHIVDPELLVIDDFEEETEELEFLELTDEQHSRINRILSGSPDEVLISKFNLNITRRDIHTLRGHNWLNDEVINFYMNLLMDRGEKRHNSDGFPTVYAMNTFFTQRLQQTGYSGVKRWTRRVDIFSKDIIPVPVHVGGVHWCMAIIHLKNRTIKYYDSMATPNPNVLNALENYLKEESLDKRKESFDTSTFVIESVEDVPRQMNGSDCGVFSCMFAEYITRDKEITFTQENMEYFRQKMILEIVQGELMQ